MPTNSVSTGLGPGPGPLQINTALVWSTLGTFPGLNSVHV